MFYATFSFMIVNWYDVAGCGISFHEICKFMNPDRAFESLIVDSTAKDFTEDGTVGFFPPTKDLVYSLMNKKKIDFTILLEEKKMPNSGIIRGLEAIEVIDREDSGVNEKRFEEEIDTRFIRVWARIIPYTMIPNYSCLHGIIDTRTWSPHQNIRGWKTVVWFSESRGFIRTSGEQRDFLIDRILDEEGG